MMWDEKKEQAKIAHRVTMHGGKFGAGPLVNRSRHLGKKFEID